MTKFRVYASHRDRHTCVVDAKDEDEVRQKVIDNKILSKDWEAVSDTDDLWIDNIYEEDDEV